MSPSSGKRPVTIPEVLVCRGSGSPKPSVPVNSSVSIRSRRTTSTVFSSSVSRSKLVLTDGSEVAVSVAVCDSGVCVLVVWAAWVAV